MSSRDSGVVQFTSGVGLRTEQAETDIGPPKMRQLPDLVISAILLALRILIQSLGTNEGMSTRAGGPFGGAFFGPTVRGSWKRNSQDERLATDRDARFRPGWWMIPGALLGIALWVGVIMFLVWLF